MTNESPMSRGQCPLEPVPADAGEREPLRSIRSEELFGGDRIVLIEHAGEQYRLLITRNDRLILQK